MKTFYSTNEAREYLLGKNLNPTIVEDYYEYVSAIYYIRELTDSEFHFMRAYDEVVNGVKHND